MAAATISCLLEGPPQRAYLAVAEAKDQPAASSHNLQQRAGAAGSLRGFTTLSMSLGQLVVTTHKGLLHAATSETDPGVKQVLLRAICVMISGSPYHRLPTGVLPEAVKARLMRLHMVILSKSVFQNCQMTRP
jgi:hypothetical protein